MCLRTQLVRMLLNRSCLLFLSKSFFIFKVIIFNTSINLTCLLPKSSIRVNANDIDYSKYIFCMIWFTIVLHLNKGIFSKWPSAQACDWLALFCNKGFGRPQRRRSLVCICLFFASLNAYKLSVNLDY